MDMREHFQVGDLVEVVFSGHRDRGARGLIESVDEVSAWASGACGGPWARPSSLKLIERNGVAVLASGKAESTPPPLLAHCDRCATLQAKHANLEVDFGDRGQRIERLERANTEQAATIRRLEGELRAARGRR